MRSRSIRPKISPLRRRLSAGDRRLRRGNAMIEFSLVFLLLLSMLVGAFEFTWTLFIRATFHHAVREGVRSAITGNSIAGISTGLDDSVKAVIKENTFGLLREPELSDHVEVRYYDPNCIGTRTDCEVATADPGNIIEVSIRCYQIFPITNLIRKDPITGAAVPFQFSVAASDKMEPFPGGSATRSTSGPSGYAVATACTPPPTS